MKRVLKVLLMLLLRYSGPRASNRIVIALIRARIAAHRDCRSGWRELTHRYAQAGLHDAAEHAFVRLLEFEFDRDAWMGLGQLRMQRGRPADAAECFQRLIEDDPGDYDGWMALGHAHAGAGDFAEAAISLTRAVEIRDGDIEAWMTLGQVQTTQGRFDQAIHCFLRALEIAPADPTAWSGLANVLAATGKDRVVAEAVGQALGIQDSDDLRDETAQAYRHRTRLILVDLIEPLLPPSERFVVLDGGAREAFSDPRWRVVDASRLVIHGFEPDAQECARLNEQARKRGLTVHFHPVGLWSGDGVLAFEDNHTGGGSSFLRQNRSVTDRWRFENRHATTNARDVFFPAKIVDIPVTSIQNWAGSNDVTQIDFIKLNVQGAELEILQGCGALLDGVMGILIEVAFVESYHNRPMFADIDRFLRQTGFTFFDLLAHHYIGRADSPFVARHCLGSGADWGEKQVSLWGQLIEGHALYLRDPIQAPAPQAVPMREHTIRTLKLACFAEMFGQVEYAFELVAWLRRHADLHGDPDLARELAALSETANARYQRFICRGRQGRPAPPYAAK